MLLGLFFLVKVKEKGEEIMYFYGECNFKEKLKIFIFEIQEVNCIDKSGEF